MKNRKVDTAAKFARWAMNKRPSNVSPADWMDFIDMAITFLKGHS